MLIIYRFGAFWSSLSVPAGASIILFFNQNWYTDIFNFLWPWIPPHFVKKDLGQRWSSLIYHCRYSASAFWHLIQIGQRQPVAILRILLLLSALGRNISWNIIRLILQDNLPKRLALFVLFLTSSLRSVNQFLFPHLALWFYELTVSRYNSTIMLLRLSHSVYL